jgi:hypothetical protein
MMISPFATMFGEDDGLFVPFDPEVEERKLYVRRKAYLPPLDNCRSIPATKKKFKDTALLCDKGGLLFARRRCVSFNDRVQKFTYEL